MTTSTRKTAGRRRRTGLVYFILFLLLVITVFFGIRKINAYKADIQDPDTAGYQDPASDASPADGSSKYRVQTMEASDISAGELILVNGGHSYSPSAGPELVSIYDEKDDCYFVRDMDVRISRDVMEALNALMKGFYEATGINDVNVVSGFRTVEEQEDLYNASVEKDGAAHAAKFVAQAGCSEHHTGLAMDLSIYHIATGTSEEFDGDGDYGWIAENAWQYGFILRYTESKYPITNVGDEPWHYRYVGIPHARYIKEHDLCLEEYIDLLYQYPYDSEHLKFEGLGQRYEIYYCAGTDVPIPQQGEYTVSGNNIDGFIVTAEVNE